MRVKEKLKKLIAIIIIVITCSFAMPNYSHAIDSKLGKPFQAAICFIGDAFMNGLQKFFIGDKAVIGKSKKKTELNIKYSVASIVSNKIPMFDINFFTGGESIKTEVKDDNAEKLKEIYSEYVEKYCQAVKEVNNGDKNAMTLNKQLQKIKEETHISLYWKEEDIKTAWKQVYPGEEYENSELYILMTNDFEMINTNAQNGETKYKVFFKEENGEILVDESKIRQVLNLGVMPINQNATNKIIIVEKKSSADVLKPIVQKWYYAFRNLALIALLSILLYLGIKIVLSSVAEDKARYKKLLTNWLVALAILFMLHYIMAFTLTIIDEITDVISKNNIVTTDGADSLMMDIREKCEDDQYTINQMMTYTILYMVLVVYVVKFTWVYIKRVIHLSFLTIVAPLIAVTYPLDKEKDGKAQAFDMWTKEYFFNALLQPMHLLLYYVLVSSATQLVTENCIYAIVVIGFMSHAEKLIRQMFGMSKAGNASSLGSFTGGALASSAISKLSSGGKSSGSNGGGNNASNDEEANTSGIKMAKLDDVFEDIGTPSVSGATVQINGGLHQGNQGNIWTPGTSGSVSGETPRGNVRSTWIPGTLGSVSGETPQENVSATGTSVTSGSTGRRIPQGNTRIIWTPGTSGSVSGETLRGNVSATRTPSGSIAGGTPQENQGNTRMSETTVTPNTTTTPNIGNKNKNKKTVLSRTIKGTVAVGKAGAEKVFTLENGKKAIRTVANVAGGSVGAVAGIATGIAAGDLSKVIEYGGIGATAGIGITNKALEGAGKITGAAIETTKNTIDTYQKGYYGDDKEYQDKVLIPKLKEKNSKDDKIKDKYKKAGFDDWKKTMNSSTRDKLYHAGVVNEDTIISALKIKQKDNISDEELVQDVIVASNISSYKDAQTMEKELKQRLQDTGMDEKTAQNETKRRMKHIKKIAGL